MTGLKPAELALTEEEAFALLSLAMTSPAKLDVTSEKAIRKLAEYCKNSHHSRFGDEPAPVGLAL